MITDENREKYNLFNADMIQQLFIQSCKSGDLDIVVYVLTSKDLKIHANISLNKSKAFRKACSLGHLNIVKFLLEYEDIKDQTDIHAKNDEAFRLAYKNGHMKIVDYLIFDYGIEKTASIKMFISQKNLEDIELKFNLRTDNQILNNSLLDKKLVKNIKI